MPPRILTDRVDSLAALGEEWRALEAAAEAPSFFQSWSWVGCLAAERFPDPLLLRAVAGGRTIGLALCNRRGGRLHLTESGVPRMDRLFVEHNAPLLSAEAPAGLAAGMLGAALGLPGTRRLVLAGVPPALLAAVPGTVLRRQDRPAPRVELAALRAAGQGYRASLSRNARHQLARSLRRYGERGPVTLARAATLAEALSWFDAMVALHGADWRRRGLDGAFADPWIRRFHHALIAEAFPRGEIDLLRVAAGAEAIGYLYNFRLRGWVHAYQGGFDRAGADPHMKPGLTCHLLAIEAALAEGAATYDFLAGAARWKASLGNAVVPLAWAECVRRGSPLGLLARARQVLARRG